MISDWRHARLEAVGVLAREGQPCARSRISVHGGLAVPGSNRVAVVADRPASSQARTRSRSTSRRPEETTLGSFNRGFP